MMDESLKSRYIDILVSKNHSSKYATDQKMTVLNNIESYLVEEEIRMIAQDKKWKEYSEKENLKEMGDVSSGMASTVVQLFLSSVLESFIHPSVQVINVEETFNHNLFYILCPGSTRGFESDSVDLVPGSGAPCSDCSRPYLHVH